MYRGFNRQFARKRDANDTAIADQARECGFEVIPWGAADYLVAAFGVWIPVEVKNLEGRAYGRKKQLTDGQVKLREAASRSSAPFLIWYTPADVIQTWAALHEAEHTEGKPIAAAIRSVMAAIERRTSAGATTADSARTPGQARRQVSTT